jgi:outer membrane protein assembly factor BamB
MENDILAMYGNGNILRVNSFSEDYEPLPFPALGAKPLAAAGRNGRAAVFLANGQMKFLSGDDGKVLWTSGSFIKPRSNEEKAELIFDRRGIYALCASGAAGFSIDGNLRWFANLENASGVPAFSYDGVLYSGGKDWVMNAWKIEDHILNQKQNLYGPAQDAFYGTGNPPPSIYAFVIGRFNETLVKRELEIIQTGIASGSVGGNELEWLAYLMETADGGYWPVPNRREPKAAINHRILALQLLSRMGSIEIVPWLVSFFKRENEPAVRIAAALAIGGIGMDPDGRAIQEFTAAVRTGSPIRDEQLFINIAVATGALCRFSGPPLYNSGSQLLRLLDNPRYSYMVRRQAQHELNSLK